MMAHVAPTEYNYHGREGSSYNPAADYYATGPYPPQLPPDPAVYYRHPPRNLSDDAAALADTLAGMDIASRSRLVPPQNNQIVVNAIEAAASVLRDQASALREQIAENERLRSALRVSDWELQNYRIDQGVKQRLPENDDVQTMPNFPHLRPPTPERAGNSVPVSYNRDPWIGHDFLPDPSSSLIVHPNAQSFSELNYQSNGVTHAQPYTVNGASKPRNQPDGGISQTSSPSARSVGREGESDPRTNPGRQGSAYQDLVPEEIQQLRKLVSDAQIRELQLVHENRLLQARIHELRMNVTKYQQDLMDRAPSTDMLDENARLTSEIRAANQDINFYASSLMSLLAEFNLQPAAMDPHSIVSGVKTLVQRLREDGRKDLQPAKLQWRNPPPYQQPTHMSSPSPVHPMSRAPQSPEPHGLELVPTYQPTEIPQSPTSPLSRTPREWEIVNSNHDNYPNDNIRLSTYPRQAPEPLNNSTFHPRNENNGSLEEDANPTGHPFGADYNERERLSPQLPTLPEEEGSSSDEDDPLPDIEDLCINGEAILGNKITACGISINGTTLCHFQWVRRHRDGNSLHIPGAAQPEYTITADDIDTVLWLECTPMDDRNRKGNMVQAYVNDNSWITLEPDMKDDIDNYLAAGQASFNVNLKLENTQESIIEPGKLTLRRNDYELKKSNGKRVIAYERYVEALVEIRVGKDAQCAIISNGVNYFELDCEDNRLRDLIVLTMREFIKQAFERKKGKKRVSLWK